MQKKNTYLVGVIFLHASLIQCLLRQNAGTLIDWNDSSTDHAINLAQFISCCVTSHRALLIYFHTMTRSVSSHSFVILTHMFATYCAQKKTSCFRMENVKEVWQTRRCSKAKAARQRRVEGGKEMKEKEEIKKRLERKRVSGTSQEENRSSS